MNNNKHKSLVLSVYSNYNKNNFINYASNNKTNCNSNFKEKTIEKELLSNISDLTKQEQLLEQKAYNENINKLLSIKTWENKYVNNNASNMSTNKSSKFENIPIFKNTITNKFDCKNNAIKSLENQNCDEIKNNLLKIDTKRLKYSDIKSKVNYGYSYNSIDIFDKIIFVNNLSTVKYNLKFELYRCNLKNNNYSNICKFNNKYTNNELDNKDKEYVEVIEYNEMIISLDFILKFNTSEYLEVINEKVSKEKYYKLR